MKKINMKHLLSEAVSATKELANGRAADRQKTYDALLFHVKDFEYLTGTEEPTGNRPGFLTFSVGSQFRLRVECNVIRYYFCVQNCPKGSEASRHWHGGYEEVDDVAEVCVAIARCIAEELNKQPDLKEATA